MEPPQARPSREHEREFDPAKYRPAPKEESTVPTEAPAASNESAPVWVERLEKVMGYRVQLYSTTDIDAAQRMLSQLRSRLDSLQIEPGRLDLSYDAPYYKVRAGDYVLKTEADTLRQRFHAAGLVDAWVVRDSIIRVIREQQNQ